MINHSCSDGMCYLFFSNSYLCESQKKACNTFSDGQPLQRPTDWWKWRVVLICFGQRGVSVSVISFLLDITWHYLHVAVLHNWPHPCQFTVSKESCLLKKKDELKKKSFSINTECATIPLEMWAPDVSLGKLASVTNSQYFCITRRDKVSYFVL